MTFGDKKKTIYFVVSKLILREREGGRKERERERQTDRQTDRERERERDVENFVWALKKFV